MIKNLDMILGESYKDSINEGYQSSRKYREAITAFLDAKEKEILGIIIQDSNLSNDRSDARLVMLAEIRAINKMKMLVS